MAASGLSTSAADPPGRLAVKADVTARPGGSRPFAVAVDADALRFEPLLASGEVSVSDLDLGVLAPVLAQDFPVVPAGGRLDLGLRLAAEESAEHTKHAHVSGTVRLTDVALVERAKREPFAVLAGLEVAIRQGDLLTQVLDLESVALEGVTVRAVRDEQGRIDLLALGPARPSGPPPVASAARVPAAASPARPRRPINEAIIAAISRQWQVNVERLAVRKGSAAFQDRGVAPVQDWQLRALTVDAQRLSTAAQSPPGQLRLRGQLENGAGVRRGPAALAVDARALRLAPLASSARVSLTDFALAWAAPARAGRGGGAADRRSPRRGAQHIAGAGTGGARPGRGLGHCPARRRRGDAARRGGAVPQAAGRGADHQRRGRGPPGGASRLRRAHRHRCASGSPSRRQHRPARAGRPRGKRGAETRGRVRRRVSGRARPGACAINTAAGARAGRRAGVARGLHPGGGRVDPPPRPSRPAPGRGNLRGPVRPAADGVVRHRCHLRARALHVAREGPVAWKGSLTMPGSGRTDIEGDGTLDPVKVRITLGTRDAPIDPYGAYFPFPARFRGLFSGDSVNEIEQSGGVWRAASRGTAWGQDIQVWGPERDVPDIRMDLMEFRGIDFSWPSYAIVDRVTFDRPNVQIERDRDGVFNLRRLFEVPKDSASPGVDTVRGPGEPAPASPTPAAPRAAAPASAAAPTAGEKSGSGDGGEGDLLETIVLDFKELAIEGGYIRFLDRTTTPTFSQDMSNLELRIRDLSNVLGRQRTTLTVTALVGGDAGLDIRGELSGIGETLRADLVGELRDYQLSTANPYADLSHLVDHRARQARGQDSLSRRGRRRDRRARASSLAGSRCGARRSWTRSRTGSACPLASLSGCSRTPGATSTSTCPSRPPSRTGPSTGPRPCGRA